VNVEILSLCDAANTDSTGKLNILGVFDQVMALAEPIVHPACTVAVRMRFDKIEEGAKALKIAIVDADGREVFPTLNSNIQVRVPEGLSSGTVQILLGIQQLKLPRFGEYQIDVAIDGRVVGSIPLIAKQIPQQPSPAA
jgi:hypothetical protein